MGSKYIGAMTLALVLSLSILPRAIARQDQAEYLGPGEYDVSVRLELPHLDTTPAMKVATICISAEEVSPNLGLAVLSDNNPLAKCPTSNVQRSGGVLTFYIICPGVNAASASAVYNLRVDRFDGRINMKMGGKNMTMTEVQSGRRVGDCRPPDIPRS